MGGAKKKSMAQMEKSQGQQDKKDETPEQQKKGKSKSVAEKRPRGLQVPDVSDAKFLSDVHKMGAITPFGLASQFNLRLSVAKDLLEDLERKRLIRLVGGNARVRIYQPAAA